MSLMTLQIDLQETNRQLARIADALERLAPEPAMIPAATLMKAAQKVSPTSPAATWQQTRDEMEMMGRYQEIVAGAYGPRSLKRD